MSAANIIKIWKNCETVKLQDRRIFLEKLKNSMKNAIHEKY